MEAVSLCSELKVILNHLKEVIIEMLHIREKKKWDGKK